MKNHVFYIILLPLNYSSFDKVTAFYIHIPIRLVSNCKADKMLGNCIDFMKLKTCMIMRVQSIHLHWFVPTALAEVITVHLALQTMTQNHSNTVTRWSCAMARRSLGQLCGDQWLWLRWHLPCHFLRSVFPLVSMYFVWARRSICLMCHTCRTRLGHTPACSLGMTSACKSQPSAY